MDIADLKSYVDARFVGQDNALANHVKLDDLQFAQHGKQLDKLTNMAWAILLGVAGTLGVTVLDLALKHLA